MRVKKTLIYIGMTIFFISCFLSSISYACWGVRPLAMGGAFTGVADSVDSVYWNPAGLAQLGASELNSTYITNWHDANYDIYLAAAGPVQLYKPGGLGFAYVYNKDYLAEVVSQYGNRLGWIAQDWHYFQLGYGTYLVKDWNLALGVGVKGVYSEFEVDIGYEDLYGRDERIDDATTFDVDFGVHWAFGQEVGRHKMFSLGVLVQDILESELEFKSLGLTQKFVTNVRPGVAFRPDENTIFSFELYNVLRRGEYSDGTKPDVGIRAGAERWFGFGTGRKIVALRLGGYHLNEDNLRAATGGLGWRFAQGFELAYTFMYWDKVDDTSHFVALNFGGF